MSKIRRIGLLGLIGLMIAVAASRAGADSTATFLPLWLPQAQFAGYYVAADKGIYRARGVDVAIGTGGPDNPASAALQSGAVDFGLLWLSTAIQMRSRGVGIVHVGQARCVSPRSADRRIVTSCRTGTRFRRRPAFPLGASRTTTSAAATR